MMKDEMLPILARLPATMDALADLKRAAITLGTACKACDGTPDNIEVVLDAADAVRSASAECATLARDVSEYAYRVADRLP